MRSAWLGLLLVACGSSAAPGPARPTVAVVPVASASAATEETPHEPAPAARPIRDEHALVPKSWSIEAREHPDFDEDGQEDLALLVVQASTQRRGLVFALRSGDGILEPVGSSLKLDADGCANCGATVSLALAGQRRLAFRADRGVMELSRLELEFELDRASGRIVLARIARITMNALAGTGSADDYDFVLGAEAHDGQGKARTREKRPRRTIFAEDVSGQESY
jgi:hypothetical protein